MATQHSCKESLEGSRGAQMLSSRNTALERKTDAPLTFEQKFSK
jgi:hypothetical protein